MIEQLEPQAILDLFAAHNRVTLTQSLPVVLTIDVQDFVEYRQDVSDPATFATNPNVTTAATLHNFFAVTMLADIVAVNGQLAKGLYAATPRTMASSPTPAPGRAIADVTRNSLRDLFFEILKTDSTPIGSIAAFGLSGGNAPPGAPSVLQGSNWAIIGGTGAFLGARGQAGSGAGNSPRAASITEDPANRRINGGGNGRFILEVIPTVVPQVLITADGPAVVHSSNHSLVTSSNRAAPGEHLSLFATGLGPVAPAVGPGQPFPPTPPETVNSPVAVTVNGEAAQVLSAVGYPGATDGYQVDFQVPANTTAGVAAIQLSAAWIAGPAVKIAVQ